MDIRTILPFIVIVAMLSGCAESGPDGPPLTPLPPDNSGNPPPPTPPPVGNEQMVVFDVLGLQGDRVDITIIQDPQLTEADGRREWITEILSNGQVQAQGVSITTGSTVAMSILSHPGNPDQVCEIFGGEISNVTSTVTPEIVCGDLVAVNYQVDGVEPLSEPGMLRATVDAADSVTSYLFDFTDDDDSLPELVPAGSELTIVIAQAPTEPDHDCTIGNGGPRIVAGEINNVMVSCTARYQMRYQVDGLEGNRVEFVINADAEVIPLTIRPGDSQSGIIPDRTFSDGAALSVGVVRSLTNPDQVCTSGIDRSNLESGYFLAVIDCRTLRIVEYTVEGLEGSGGRLDVNAERDSTEAPPFAEGLQRVPGFVADGSQFELFVAEEPRNPSQRCEVRNGGPRTIDGNVQDIVVTCREVFSIE